MNDLKKKYVLLSVFLFVFIVSCSEKKAERLVLSHDVFKGLDKKSSLNFTEEKHFVTVEVDSPEVAESIKKQAHRISHELGRCGGFTEDSPEEIKRFSKILARQDETNSDFLNQGSSPLELKKVEETKKTIKELSAESIEKTIRYLSSFTTRSARSSEPNKPIYAFKEFIIENLKNYEGKYTIETIAHSSTKQESIHVRVIGSETPEEIVVLGGHVDSITSFWSNTAPGADDNASGSAVIFETLKGLLASDFKPKRTVDFYWYAAEEQGLIGSKEIAKDHADKEADVVAVMQLDMVLFPGNGDVIGLTSDNTNVSTTDFVEQIVKVHLNLPTQRYNCGYGCSDHASWHRNGFKTVYPFEATFGTHNRNIHTKNDLIDSRSSLEHALRFSKISSAFLHEVSNTSIRF